MRLILRTSLVMIVLMLLFLDVQQSSASIPSRQTRFITFSNVQATTMKLDWVRGNGNGVLVLARAGSAPDVSSLGENYDLLGNSGSADFGAATVLGSTQSKLLYKGGNSTLTVSGLSAGTTYYFMIVEWNTNGSNYDILKDIASFNPRNKATLPLALNPPAGLSSTAQTATTATISWSDGSGAVGYYLDVQYDKDYVTGYDLLDIGDNATNIFLITGLAHPSDTKYRFRLRSYDGNGNVSNPTDWVTFSTTATDPVISTAPGTGSMCGLSFVLSATISSASGYNPSPATGTWTTEVKPSGAGTPTFTPGITTPGATVTVSSYGTYEFKFQINVGAYISSGSYTVEFKAAPTANAGTDNSQCGSPRTYTLSGSTLSTGQTGTWTYVTGPVGGTASFGNANSNSSTASVNMDGAYTYMWTVSNGTCSASDNVVITYSPAPTTASAGNDGSHCGLTGYSMSGNTPSVGTGVWSVVSGPGSATFGNSSSATSTVSVSLQGTYTFKWKISNGTCTSSDDVDVVFYASPSTASVGNSNETTCGYTLVLDAYTPSVGTGTWTTVSAPLGAGTPTFSITNANSPTATVTVDKLGAWSFAWTVGTGNGCTSTCGKQIYFNGTATTASAGSDQTVCGMTSSMAGNSPTVGTGSWSQVSGVGTATFGNYTSPTSTIMVPAFSGSSQTYSLKWTITNGTCDNNSDNVDITFYNSPTTANAGTADAACGLTYTLMGNTPTVGTGSWSQISGVGTASFGSITNPNSGVTIPSFSGANTAYTFKWTISNGTCSASTANVVITFNNAPTTANAGTDGTNCGLTGYSLSGNNPTVGTGSWTKVSGPGTVSFGTPTSNNSTAVPSMYGSYTYRWTISNGTCSSSSDEVMVTYYEAPTTASAGSDNSTCTGSYQLAGNNPSVGTGTWTQVSGTGVTFADANSYNTTATFPSIGTYQLMWTIGNGTCSTSSDVVDITYYNLTANAGNDATGCFPEYTLSATSASPGTGTWTKVSGPGTATFSSMMSNNSNVTISQVGSYTFRWSVSNGSCSASDDVVISFANQVAFAPGQVISGSQTVSAGTPNVQYSVPSVDGAINYTWTYLPSTGIAIQGSGTNTYTTNNVIKIDFGLTATTGTLSLIPNGPCGAGPAIYLPITVTNDPVILTSSLNNTNNVVTITTNDNVYTNNNCSGDLLITDFQLIFNKNAGTATNAALTSITKVDQKTWQLHIAVTGTPNGCETIEIKPLANQVWNCSTTAMANTQTTGVMNLFNMNEPTTASSVANVPSATIYASQMMLNWTNGNGNNRIVVASTSSAIVPPTDFSTYTANPQYGAGSITASNNYVVYNGNGNTVTVTGLAANTTYYYQVFEYNQTCGTSNYMMTGATASAATQPTATKLVITSKPSLISSGVAFSITVEAQDNAGTPRYPLCNEAITLNTNGIGSITNNSGSISPTSTSVTMSAIAYTNAAGEMNVMFTADDATGISACGNDLASDFFTINLRASEPTTQASGIKFTSSDQHSIGLYWSKGSGNGRALVVKKVVGGDNVPADALTDGMSLLSVKDNNSSAIGLTTDGLDLGTSKGYAVYRTEGTDSANNAVLINELASGTSYSFRVTEFNHAPGDNDWSTYNYKTSGLASLNPRSKATGSKIGSFSGVEISDFYARSYDAKAELNWEAISEDGITGYEIYRMNPEVSENFVKIGNMDVKTAVGGNNVYKLVDGDNSLKLGNEYFYRLVGVGFDGQRYELSETSLTILSMPNDDNSLYISEVNPNPVKDVLRFNVQTVKSAPVTIEIRNSIGQVIFTEDVTINGVKYFEYNMNAKAAGKYFITVSSGPEAKLTSFVLVP